MQLSTCLISTSHSYQRYCHIASVCLASVTIASLHHDWVRIKDSDLNILLCGFLQPVPISPISQQYTNSLDTFVTPSDFAIGQNHFTEYTHTYWTFFTCWSTIVCIKITSTCTTYTRAFTVTYQLKNRKNGNHHKYHPYMIQCQLLIIINTVWASCFLVFFFFVKWHLMCLWVPYH